MSAASLTTAHAQFEAALPAITSAARHAFRRRRPQDRDEAVAEACACAWKAWSGLVERGKDPVAVGVSGIAGYAVRHVLNGRRIGHRGGGRGGMDVYHFRAQASRGFKVVSLDRDAGREPGRGWTPGRPPRGQAGQLARRWPSEPQTGSPGPGRSRGAGDRGGPGPMPSLIHRR